MLTHLKYLAVGGSIIFSVCAGVYVLTEASPLLVIGLILSAISYGLGWAYYYHRSGQ